MPTRSDLTAADASRQIAEHARLAEGIKDASVRRLWRGDSWWVGVLAAPEASDLDLPFVVLADSGRIWTEATPQGRWFEGIEEVALHASHLVAAGLPRVILDGRTYINQAAVDPFRFDPSQPRDQRGRWTRGMGYAAVPFGREDLSNPDTPRTRAVSMEEFQTLAMRGNERLDQMRQQATDAKALDGKRWVEVKARAYADSREPWGGATIEAHSGEFLTGDEDAYALTVKPKGMDSVTVSPSASKDEFDAAMEEAKSRFGEQLRYEGSYLGVFHDDDLKRIDIDPIVVVRSLDAVEEIGAFTHAVGGAYHFSDGLGYWPPYVED